MRLSIVPVVLVSFWSATPADAKDFVPPRVSVSLDDPPEHRWDHVALQFNSSIHSSVAKIISTSYLQDVLKVAETAMKKDPTAVSDWYPDEQWPEMQGIARVTGLDIWELAAINTIYDFTAGKGNSFKACTSIIAENSQGEIVHGRNLDYGLRAAMRNITAIVDFTRGGKTVYTSVSIILMTGFNTGVKPGVFSITQDERDQGSLVENFKDLFVGKRHSTFATIRQVVEHSNTFEEAVNTLSTVPLSAGSYFNLGGVQHGEGAIVTRDRDSAADVWRLGGNSTHGSVGSPDENWYVFETNYDHWQSPGDGDNRRTPGRSFMDAKGPKNFGPTDMWEAVSNKVYNQTNGERPIYNDETVYSIVMQAAHPEGMKVLVRDEYPEPTQSFSGPHLNAWQ